MWRRIGSLKSSHLQGASFRVLFVIKKFLFVICFFCLVNAWCLMSASAQDISFDATVNANKISLQDILELTLTVHGAKADGSTVPLPAVDGFETRFVGPATSFSIVNGVSSSERSFIYNLFPTKSGHFQIPSVPLVIDGKTYTTAPIDVDVVNKPSEASNMKNTEVSLEQSIDDKVFMRTSIEPKEVYLGQKTPIVMTVYVKDLSLQLASAPFMTPDGLTADNTASMHKDTEVINGVTFNTLRFDANIYPNRLGDLNVGPFQAVGELIYRVKRNTNDLFGDLFATEQTRPVTLHSPAISFRVLPLPQVGRPADFSGAVGQYDFKVTVGPLSVKLGDPITMRMTISGQGRFKGLVMHSFNDEHFKMYDPQIKEDENSKTLEQVIIPTGQNITQVPALSFSYFDPQAKQYKTITQGPFPIKILPSGVGQEFKAYGFIEKTKQTTDKPIVVKIDGAKRFACHLLDKSKIMARGIRFWPSLLVIAFLWFVFGFWMRFQHRLENDTVFARRWKADSKARELLKTTKVYLQQNNSKEFYSSLNKTLNDYLADKMHVPLASLSWHRIETHLKERSVEALKLETIKTLFEHCDLVRFASATLSSEQMHKDFDQLQDLISYLPKVLK
ncbi:MAG: BatD family protein [Candidatus Omnitrophota bacterium]